MKRLIIAFVLGLALQAGAQSKPAAPPATLKSVLLDELRSTHSKSDWFVCANVAVANLTPEQASWKDGKGNHSVGQLAYHLVFWNKQELAKLRGQPAAKFSGDNEETFDSFDSKRWSDSTRDLDQVMTDLEKLVESADDKKLAEWAPQIANISTHNAYHTGQIVYVRKEQGSWDASKGVK